MRTTLIIDAGLLERASGFGRGGYMRLSLTIPRGDIERSLPGFERVIRKARGNKDDFTAETPRR